jgi:hypothetical protein
MRCFSRAKELYAPDLHPTSNLSKFTDRAIIVDSVILSSNYDRLGMVVFKIALYIAISWYMNINRT